MAIFSLKQLGWSDRGEQTLRGDRGSPVTISDLGEGCRSRRVESRVGSGEFASEGANEGFRQILDKMAGVVAELIRNS